MIKKNIILLFILGMNLVTFSQEKPIEVTYKVNDDKSVVISYKKKVIGSYTITIDFDNLRNTYETSFSKIVKRSSGVLIKLKPENPKNSIGFSYKASFSRGVINPKIDTLFKYAMPFKKGKQIKINHALVKEEFRFTKNLSPDWKAYKVYTKTADTICAMRKGIVIKIPGKDRSSVYRKYASKRNKIIIEHEDGTFATYNGFDNGKIFVKLGQTVYPYTNLGVLTYFQKEKGVYRLGFDIRYRSTLIESETSNKVLSSFIVPYFFTINGSIKIEDQKEYISVFNKDILIKEFTRREKRKYKKKSYLFQ